MREILNAKQLIDRDMYDYYRDNRKKVAKGIDQYKLWVKAMNGFLETMKRMLIQNENGIYLEGFGYFYIEKKYQRKKRISLLRKEIKSIHRVCFKFEDESLNERFVFSTKKSTYVLDNTKNYEPKLEEIKYIIQVKKLKWNT